MHLFDDLGRSSREQQEQAAELNFEAGRVKYLMGVCGFKPRDLNQVRAAAGGRLSFPAFHAEFPDFPYLLRASRLDGVKLHEDQKAILPRWFDRFLGLPFMPVFEDVLAEVWDTRNGRGVGLVFPRKGFAQGLVVHSAAALAGWSSGPCFAYKADGVRIPCDLYVRPFSALVKELAVPADPTQRCE